jgi:hypothetical protein
MAAARIVAAARFAIADEPAPPETLDVVRRQRQLLRRAAALCLDPIAEETDDMDANPEHQHLRLRCYCRRNHLFVAFRGRQAMGLQQQLVRQRGPPQGLISFLHLGV